MVCEIDLPTMPSVPDVSTLASSMLVDSINVRILVIQSLSGGALISAPATGSVGSDGTVIVAIIIPLDH
jgi:hypothetical protein